MAFQWSAVGIAEVNGVRLGYRDAGNPAGVPAVLLHGTGSSAGTWDRFAARLTALGYRVIAVDLRGHAASARTADYALDAIRDDVLDLLEILDLRDAVLVGHSVGGYAALAAARHAPDRVARLVLEDVAAPPRRLPGWHDGPLRLLTAAASRMARSPVGINAAIVLQLVRPDPIWWDRLREIHQPTLVVSGGRASYLPPRRLAEVAAALPDARFATIPVGHRVHSLAPDAFGAEVEAFLPAVVSVQDGAGAAV